ncbi:hypothetical protein GCM10011519_05550 [Marmoricola endophyticus]|uniref:Uncharacterized protein n=1 Tax=Marmoricola endophyticus TaxID=2040280 RepID=A0A917EZY3_9ACTN|nr:hypothetical protein [Marmoricola endophyticus]GGF34991.1 hypothetical protein GCM10011519_05550 [Marmoricola endophyticus]
MPESPKQSARADNSDTGDAAPAGVRDNRSAKVAFVVLIPVSLLSGTVSPFVAEGQCADSCNDALSAAGIIGGWGSVAVAILIGLVAELLVTTGRNHRPMAPWAWGAVALPIAGAVFAAAMGSIAAG